MIVQVVVALLILILASVVAAVSILSRSDGRPHIRPTLTWNSAAAIFAGVAALASTAQAYISWNGRNDLMKAVTIYSVSTSCSAATASATKFRSAVQTFWFQEPIPERKAAAVLAIEAGMDLMHLVAALQFQGSQLKRPTEHQLREANRRVDQMIKRLPSLHSARTFDDLTPILDDANEVRVLALEVCADLTSSLTGPL